MPWGWELRFHLWTYVWPVVAVDVFNPSPKSKGGPGVVFPPKQICRFGPYHDWRSSTEGLRGSIDAHHPILATYHARNHVFSLFMAQLYSYHGSLQKLPIQCQNQQALQWTRSIRLATSETLLLSPHVSTNEQSNMQGSKLPSGNLT